MMEKISPDQGSLEVWSINRVKRVPNLEASFVGLRGKLMDGCDVVRGFFNSLTIQLSDIQFFAILIAALCIFYLKIIIFIILLIIYVS